MSGAAIPAGRTDAEQPAMFAQRQADIWFFVFFEAFLFTGYFTVYMLRRLQELEVFLLAQAQLSLAIGCFNTLVLLLSSWSMARCVHAARRGAMPDAMRMLRLTFGFGLAFMILKIIEWALEIDQSLTFTSNAFFAFYYFLTALHFIHLLIGFVFLGVMFVQLRRREGASQTVIESCAAYWHMVDFLWVMIFALLYLIR